MRIKILLLAVLSAFCLMAQAGYDEKYKAYSGDLNGDGYADLFLSRPPEIILLHGDVVTPIIIPSTAKQAVLVQNSDQTFTIDDTLTPSELNVLNTWVESPVELVVRDINVDGQLDLLITNFSGDGHFYAGTYDQIVFASNDSLAHVRAVDAEFKQFFEEIYGYSKDSDYFENTAISNGWYHYDGEEKTGWWYITYINYYYQYDEGKLFLDDNDDPTDPNNTPAFCYDYPTLCAFNSQVGYWWIYGKFLANIELVVEYDNFNQDALSYAQAAGTAFEDPNVALQSDPAISEQILEDKLEVEVGETVAGVLLDPLPWPELPPETQPLPKPRRIPLPLPEPANDPAWFPKKDWGWKILTRVGFVVCGLLICSEEGEDDELFQWEQIGWEWAIQDLLENEIDETEQPKVVIGEGEGEVDGAWVFARIPDAAATYGAVYFDLGVDDQGEPVKFTSGQWSDRTETLLWRMNRGWIRIMMLRKSQFYDIGLYGPREGGRGRFYPCERTTLEGYIWREERYFGGTGGFTYGNCEL